MPGHSKPTLVLVHGLDSTRFTWEPFITKTRGRFNILAVDQRGHGESDLGAEDEYSPQAIVSDIRLALASAGETGPVVLCGHSMGGKVAMAYAAQHPEDVAALIIEDMDLVLRPQRMPPDMAARREFSRHFVSWEAASSVLKRFGYDQARIEGWKKDGRVFQRADGSWWSGINPMAQWLALTHVLGAVGEKEWSVLADHDYPIRVFVAGKGSACREESVKEMQSIVPRARIVRFENAWHSIHNSDMPAFIEAIEEVYTVIQEEHLGKHKDTQWQAKL